MFLRCNTRGSFKEASGSLLRLSHCIYGEQVWKLPCHFEGTDKKGKGKCYNHFDNGRKWEKDVGGKKKVLLTSLGAEARFSLSALAVGILESCSQILQSPSWATPWLQVTASVMARRRWAAAPSTRSTFNGAARQWPTFLAAPSPPSPGAQVYAGGTPASSGRPRGLAAQLRTSKPARIFLLLKKKYQQ